MTNLGNKPESPDDDWNGLSDEEILKRLEKLALDSPELADDGSGEKARAGLEILRQATPKLNPSNLEPDPLEEVLGSKLANDPGLHERLRNWLRPKAGTLLNNRYKLLEQIGEGGMGSVWVGEQLEPVRRRVAIKLLKSGMDSRQILARFEAERQALAAMDHPNIARILDGGITDTRSPYFVMELVDGANLTKFCDEARLGIRQRLELFSQVTQGVQHAHQKGIIHRDLKPSNILVTLIDGRPFPKIIDFGLAKAVGDQPNRSSSLATNFGAVVGTLEYMSPEQAGYSGQDVDTRTDIYALGVILYELLTGLRPFDSVRLQAAALDEMLRIIKEEDPARPSARLSSSDSAPSAAALRQTEPKSLAGLLRHELDWIVMKALEKDRSRRYDTANDLVADVQRYLAGEPVLAHPPGPGYRLQKFIRRNRFGVIAAGMVGAALTIGLATTMWQAQIARQQAARADNRASAAEAAEKEQRRLAASEAALRREAQTQKELAEKSAAAEKERAEELEQVTKFQTRMLDKINPTVAGKDLMEDLKSRLQKALEKDQVDEDSRAQRISTFEQDLKKINATDTATEMIDRTILKPASEEIEGRFKEQPAIAASLRQSLALLYRDLGRFNDAVPLLQQSLEARRKLFGEDDKRSITSLDELALTLQYAGKLAESEPLARESLERKQRIFGNEFVGTLIAMNNVGLLLHANSKFKEAEPLFREAVTTSRRVLGPDDENTLTFISNLAMLLNDDGRPEEAEPFSRESLERRRKVFGIEHPNSLSSLNNYALLLRNLQRFDEAAKLSEECLEVTRRVMGEEHPQTLAAIHNYGFTIMATGNVDAAEPYYRQSMELHRKVMGFEHPSSILATANMANLLQTQGKFELAESLRKENLEICRRKFGNDHSQTSLALNTLANLHDAQGKPELAEPLRREVLEVTRRTLGDEHLDTLVSTVTLANTIRLMKQPEVGEKLIREVLGVFEKTNGPESIPTTTAKFRLGQCLLDQQKFSDAETLILLAAKVQLEKPTVKPPRKIEILESLIRLYEGWETAEPNQGHAAMADPWRKKLNALQSLNKK